MSFINGSALELSAQMFATLALKTEATEAFALKAQFVVIRSGSSAGTLLPEEDLRANLAGEFDPAAVEGFLETLQSGRLHDFRYAAIDGGFRMPEDKEPRAIFTQKQILSRMDPVSQELKAAAPSVHRPWVDLTRGMTHLHAIQNIGRDIFEEAFSRVLDRRHPDQDDLLWLHAEEGQLNRLTVTHPLRLTSKPPFVDAKAMYGRDSTRFPVITLEFDEGAWQMKEQYVYSSAPIKRVVLSALVGTKWPVHFIPRPTGASRKSPRPSRHYPVADFFFDNEWAIIVRGPGRVVSMTQPFIKIAELEKIPIDIFRQAVQWALGRSDLDGDRLAFTAGEGFSKGDEIEDCLILCPAMPKSRSSSLFPKVWMERRDGEWVILTDEISGDGAAEMVEALITHPVWNLTSDRRSS